jgi:chromosome segregation protein
LPAGLKPAIDAVANLDASHPAASILSACYLADDLGAFLEFWQANPAFSFLMVATAKGDLVDRRGLIYGGHHKKPANSIVQREVDIRETGKAVVAESQAHDDQKAVIDQLNAALAEAEQTLEQKRKEVLATSQLAASIHTEEKNAQKAHDDAVNRLARMENELNNLKRDHDEALSRLAKAQALLAEAEAGVAAQKQMINATEAVITDKRADRDQKKEILAQARLELAERRQKVEVLDRGLTEMERRGEQLEELITQRQIELETWTEQVNVLEEQGTGQQAPGRGDHHDPRDGAGERRKGPRRTFHRRAGNQCGGGGALVHPRRSRVLPGRAVQARGQGRRDPRPRAVPDRGGHPRIPGRHRHRRTGASCCGTPTTSPRG